MALLKNINYSKMLYSTMGRYFAINKAGLLSRLYKYCLCLLWPYQMLFNSFDTWRRKMFLIASCNWQIGQLINLLNYLYDPTQKRIFITQAKISYLYLPDIDDGSITSFTYFPDIDFLGLSNMSSLGIAGINYIVMNDSITYNGTVYQQGQSFTTVTGITTFTGTGIVTFATFEPDIDSIFSKITQVFINLPNEIFINSNIVADIKNTLDQIKLSGLIYIIQSI